MLRGWKFTHNRYLNHKNSQIKPTRSYNVLYVTCINVVSTSYKKSGHMTERRTGRKVLTDCTSETKALSLRLPK
jgi:hypothetical protein